MSTRNENSSPQEIRTLPNHVAHREPRGGDVSQGEAHGRDEIVWPGYERGYTPVILASSAGGGGGFGPALTVETLGYHRGYSERKCYGLVS